MLPELLSCASPVALIIHKVHLHHCLVNYASSAGVTSFSPFCCCNSELSMHVYSCCCLSRCRVFCVGTFCFHFFHSLHHALCSWLYVLSLKYARFTFFFIIITQREQQLHHKPLPSPHSQGKLHIVVHVAPISLFSS